jgi:hypothetical protein
VGEFIDHIEHAILPPIMSAVLDKVVGRDMIAPFRSQAEAGPVCETKPPTFGLLRRHLQSLLAPDPFNPLVVHHPACLAAQQRGDLAITVAAILARQRDNILGQLVFVIPPSRRASAGRAMLPQHAANPTFRHLWQRRPKMADAGPPAAGAQ